MNYNCIIYIRTVVSTFVVVFVVVAVVNDSGLVPSGLGQVHTNLH